MPGVFPLRRRDHRIALFSGRRAMQRCTVQQAPQIEPGGWGGIGAEDLAHLGKGMVIFCHHVGGGAVLRDDEAEIALSMRW